MLKDRAQQISLVLKVTDFIIAVVAYFLTFYARFHRFPGGSTGFVMDDSLWILVMSLALHWVLYPYLQFYASIRMRSSFQILRTTVIAFFIELAFLSMGVFAIQAKETSRWVILSYLTANYGFVLFERLAAKFVLSRFRTRGYNFRNILIIGTGEPVLEVRRVVEARPHWGMRVKEVLTPSQIDQIEALGKKQHFDYIVWAGEQFHTPDIQTLGRLSAKMGIPLLFSLNLLREPGTRVEFLDWDGLPLISFYNTRVMTPIEAFLKRAIDVLVALIGLILTFVLGVWIKYRIQKESPGPVLYKSYRVGENGRIFKCYKFRTMKLGADQEKDQLKDANLMQGPLFKIENDPRVFAFGAFLRRTSLDELPQFFNILRGDMSAVGTRPPTPDEVEKYETHYRRRLSIKPGLTGLWQVSGRNKITNFDEVLKLDLQYIDQWSLWLDIKIIFQTVWVVLFRKGAM